MCNSLRFQANFCQLFHSNRNIPHECSRLSKARERAGRELVNQAHPIEEIKRMNEPLYEHIEKTEAEIELSKVIEDDARPA